MKGRQFGLIFILLTFAFTLLSYRMLPEQIPVHWGMNGMANRYESKAFGAFLLPLVMTILFLLMNYLPKMDPNSENYARFRSTYDLIINGIILFLFGFQIMTLSYSLGWMHNTSYVLHIFIGLLFIFMGNYMPKVRQNYFIGIRTPWALASEEVWKKTHRFGGRVLVITGFLFMASIFIPASLQGAVTMILIFSSIIIIYVGSYLFFVRR